MSILSMVMAPKFRGRSSKERILGNLWEIQNWGYDSTLMSWGDPKKAFTNSKTTEMQGRP